jgi:uncharacterized protein with von Willebrand factor type A (vWA) domain
VARAIEARDLVDEVVRFCRFLRTSGIRIHSDASQAALAAVGAIDITRRDDFRTALRMAVIHRPEDFVRYAYCFHAFWGGGRPSAENLTGSDPFAERSSEEERHADEPLDHARDAEAGSGGARISAVAGPSVEVDVGPDATSGAASAAAHGAVVPEAFVAALPRSDAAELDRIARRLAPTLATRRSRRWMRDARGRSIDLRGALRSSLRYGGTPVVLPLRSRRLARTRLVMFCDVSRSMDEHAAFFLRFSAAVLRRLWRVEVFLFATELVRVTSLWLREPWATLRLRVPDCGGGTQIGSCLTGFLDDYGGALLGGETIVMVFSDGLDAGDPDVLERALERLERRSRAIVWLNPLLHLTGYEPTARGMSVALRYVDVFSPAHDVASLWQLLERLRAMGLRYEMNAPLGSASAAANFDAMRSRENDKEALHGGS